MIKNIGRFCLILPFVVKALNLQNIIAKFFSAAAAQIVAYGTFGLVILGAFFYLNDRNTLPQIIRLWLWYFALYFAFGLLANVVNDYPVSILQHIVPLAYLISFSIFLRIEENHKLTGSIIAITFFMSSLMVIVFQMYNINMDAADGVSKFTLDRGGGLYGDANNSALVCLLSFIFTYFLFRPETKIYKVLKIVALILSLYAFFLTFSKTGFLILLIVLGLIFHKWFNPQRLLITLVLAPILAIIVYTVAMDSNSLTVVQKERIQSIANVLTLQFDKVEYSHRDILLRNMLNYIYENPILGNGVNFSVDIRGHNTIFGVWADAGVFVFLFFLFVIFRNFWISFNLYGKKKYFALAILSVLSIYMVSLQTVINQAYLIVVFVWLGYLISNKTSPTP